MLSPNIAAQDGSCVKCSLKHLRAALETWISLAGFGIPYERTISIATGALAQRALILLRELACGYAPNMYSLIGVLAALESSRIPTLLALSIREGRVGLEKVELAPDTPVDPALLGPVLSDVCEALEECVTTDNTSYPEAYLYLAYLFEAHLVEALREAPRDVDADIGDMISKASAELGKYRDEKDDETRQFFVDFQGHLSYIVEAIEERYELGLPVATDKSHNSHEETSTQSPETKDLEEGLLDALEPVREEP